MVDRTRTSSALWTVTITLMLSVWFVCAVPTAEQQGAPARHINKLIEKFESGGVAESGVDFEWIEMEHAPYAIDQLRPKLDKLAGADGRSKLAPLVRIPMEGDEPKKWAVKQILDEGALGIIAPQVSSREQALNVVRAVRYPPQRGTKYPVPPGQRGFGPQKAAAYWGLSLPDYVRRADTWPLNPDGEIFVMVIIESAEGVRNVNEIVTTPGIGGVFVGGSDLAMSLGVYGSEALRPEVDAAVQAVVKACVAHKVICGTGLPSGDDARKKRIAEGWRLFLNPDDAQYGR